MQHVNGPEDLLYSLSALRPGDAKRKFRKGIFDDYPLRGPLGQPACAYCGKWHEKLTLDHVIPKAKGGPHYARWNLVPACGTCNGKKSDQRLFEFWRPQKFWDQQREEILLAWIYSNSFVSAHTDVGSWEEWMQFSQRVLPIHNEINTKKATKRSPSLFLSGVVSPQDRNERSASDRNRPCTLPVVEQLLPPPHRQLQIAIP